MKHLLIFPLLLALASCGAFSDLSQAMSEGRGVASDLRNTLDEMKPAIDDLAASGKGIIDDVQDGLDVYEGLKGELDGLAAELKQLNKEAFKKADKDGSGDLDWSERLAYILALAGGGAEIGRRKLKAAKAQQRQENADMLAGAVKSALKDDKAS